MLAADKLLLQSDVKQRATSLREKELKLFNNNFSAVGTQAAIMAGFTLTSFVEIDLPPEKHLAKSMLHFFVTSSICVNFVTVAMVCRTPCTAFFSHLSVERSATRRAGDLCDRLGQREGFARPGRLDGLCC